MKKKEDEKKKKVVSERRRGVARGNAPVISNRRFFLAENTSTALPGHLAQIAASQDFGFTDTNSVARVDPVDGIHLSAESHAAIGTHVAKAVADFMA